MKNPIPTLRIGLLVAVCLPSVVFAQDEIPVAAPGEPPIQVINTTRNTYYQQEFPDAGVKTVSQPRGTVAALYYAFGERKEDLPAVQIPVKCRISPASVVAISGCTADTELDAATSKSLQLARYRTVVSDMPRFRDLGNHTAYVARTVPLTLDIPAIPAPNVDLTSGPLVEFSMVDLPLDYNRLAASYPSRALRMNAEGLMEIECQMQEDRSLICTPLSFDPPEHLRMFAPAVRRIFRSTRPSPQLKDGTDARGVRWRAKLKFVIPD